MADRRFIALRDVLTTVMRDAALKLAQLDMSDPNPPELTEEHVTQWVKNMTYELGKARERGLSVPPGVAVYADTRMLAAANRIALQSLRLRLEDGTELYLAPPPPSYTLGTIEQEIERAAAEHAPTEPPAKCFHCMGSGIDEYGKCPQCAAEAKQEPASPLYDGPAPEGALAR